MKQNESKPLSATEAYALVAAGDRAEQIEFRRPRDRCCFPLASLSRFYFDEADERILLSFFSEHVLIEGRCLGRLYRDLLEHKVKRIVEQGAKAEAAAGTEATTVRRIAFRSRISKAVPSATTTVEAPGAI